MSPTETTLPPEFREALRSLSLIAIEEVQHRIHEGARFYVHRFQVPVQVDPNTWNFEEREYTVWFTLVFEIRDKLTASPEYRKCEQFIKEIPILARHVDQLIGLGNPAIRFDVDRCLFSFISHQLEGDTAPNFQESRFGEAYDDLQTFLVKDEIEFEAWVPLENLRYPDTPMPITPTMTVLRTPAEVFETVFRIEEMGYRFDQVMNWESVLHFEWTGPKTIGGSPELDEFKNVSKIAEEALTALRLLKTARIRAGPIATRPKRWTPLPGGVHYRSSLGSGPPLRPPRYVLVASDGEGARNIREQLASLNEDKFRSLTLALRRFNLSYDRHHPEDRLIDQMIAFEALYLSEIEDDDRAEKRFRLGLRVAYFLESGSSRKGVYADMKRAYDVRSRIVHGGEPSLPTVGGAPMPLQDFTDKIDNYLRRSLCKFLELAQQPGTPRYMVQWEELLFPDATADP